MTRPRTLSWRPARAAAAPLAPVLALALAAAVVLPPPAAADDLGSAQLLIAGTRLTISPESQTVPLSTPTLVETALEGYDPAAGPLPESLRVVADFSGPEIDGVLTLSARPGEPLRVPRLTVRGEYRLDDVRLVDGEELLAYAAPRSAAVLVTQVLVTRVTSRPLTLDEVRSYGIVVDDDNFRAFNFTFGFAVGGEVFDYDVPVLYSALNPNDALIALGSGELAVGGSTGTTSPRFRPPRMAPFTLRLDRTPAGGGPAPPSGGCGGGGFADDCWIEEQASLPGVILFPSEVALLNQFFSVVLIAKNDAPEGDPLTVRDLAARVVLPPGLRMAETEPPTPLGVPVPVRVPGPDGELGTGDDLTFLIAQAEGMSEVLVEGRKRGTHVVEFQLEGVLDGLAGGQVARVTGTARGAVIVRDPTLGLTITHPDVVRNDEEYTLRVTVTNASNAPVNLVSVALPPGGLSGVELLSASSQTVPSLLPGDAEVLEFQLRSLRTGRVVATSVKSGSQVDPSFELTMGVGDAGVPLSPEALILPRAAESLPAAIQRHALGMLGLGVSLAAAPESLTDVDRPRLAREQIDEKAYWLAQAGRHIDLGEDEFDSVAVLAAEWTGARDGDWEWDSLRRVSRRGGLLGDAFAQTFAAEAAATSPAAAFDRFVRTTAFLGPPAAALAEGAGARLEVGSLTSGLAAAAEGTDPLARRELPFADLYGLGGAEMALLARPEPGGYQARMTAAAGGADRLTLLVPDQAGALRRVRFEGVAIAAGGLAVADFRAADELFTLYADRDGDGIVDAEIAGDVTVLSPRPFTAVAAVQNVQADPSGHVVDVLLTADLDLAGLLPVDPGRFTMPGKVSNGGLVPIERDLATIFMVEAENPFEGLRNTRIVRVIFDNPISPYAAHDLTISDLTAVGGQTLVGVTLPVVTTATEDGTRVEGTVYGPDGQPVPFARVELYEVDQFTIYPTPCRQHKTAAVLADSSGRFEFDYVRQTRCSDVFTLAAADPVSGKRGTARGRVRFIAGVQQLDVLMLGRGTLRGRVTYEDGTVPESFRVVAYSPVFFEGREARVYSDGRYEVGDVPVGTVSLVATDRLGSFVFQTEELPTAGAVRERDLVIIRLPPEEATGDVRGTVYETDAVTPVYNAYLALYIDGELAGVEHSGFDGGFDFGTVPAGLAEIEAFDGETGLRGAQVFFDVEPDQVNEVTLLLADERGTVEGHVYRQEPSGPVPVEGAVVWVSGTPFNALTDAEGFYRLDGVFAGSRTVLAADLVNQVQTSAAVTVNGGGAVTFRDLYFPGQGPLQGGISGEVLGFTGNPVPGALVHIATGGGGWWQEAVTDTLGRFTIPDLGPGSYALHAVSGAAGGTATATIRFQGETPFVTIRFKKGIIRGQVLAEDGNGQQFGVTALVTYRTTVVQDGVVGLDHQPHTLETAPDGSFEIADVLVGPYTLHVSNPFHGERRIDGDLVFHGEIHDHQIVFRQNGTIRGTVVDWDGETPVAGALVDLLHPAFALYDLTTDAEGRFTFDLVPPVSGRFPIDAEITTGTVFRRARVWVRFDRFGQELDVEIVLPRQGTVSGFVEDANGNPAPGAVVTLTEHAFPGRKLVHNADGEGRFSFPNVFSGTVSLAAKAPALGGLASKATVQVTAEGEEVFALLQLEPTGEIVGHVLSPVTGLPVPSVQVSLYRWGGGLFDSVSAGPDGAFRFVQLPLGQYRVWVFDPATGRYGEREGAWVEFNNHVREADVTLEVRGAVDGHLLDPGSGAGVPGATVRMNVSSLVPFTTYSSTDVEGYFEYLGIPESSFSLHTREPRGRRRASGSGSISVEGERVTVDLVLEASGGVAGTVLAPPGAPAGPFANVNTLLVQDGQVIGATLDNPYDFSGVIANRNFQLEAHEVGGDHRGTAGGRITSEGEVAAVDVTIEPIGEAEVTVTDSFGDPVAGADVSLRSTGFYGGFFNASSGPDGTALFTGVGEGHLDAWATNPATALSGSGSGTLTLEGERVAIAVQLADSGSVGGRVVLSDGVTPAEEALVVLTRGSRVFQAFAEADGGFDFSAVPLGSFTVFAQERFGPGAARAVGTLAANGEAIDLGTLVMDDHDPVVIELLPELYAIDQPLATVVTVHFSEPIDAARFAGSWIDFRRLSGATVGYSASWTDGDATLVLTPNAPLANFTTYQVTVDDAYDPSGRRLAERARTVFTTVDLVPPTVIDVLPRDGDNQVPIDAEIRVTFSEPVVEASLSGSSFQLTDVTAGAGVSTTWLRLASGREVILTPVGGLLTDREYRLTVQGVEDGSGNVMTVPVTTTFYSLDTIPPEITSVTLPAGTDYTAGDDVPVEVEATDLWGVAEVAVRVGAWRFADPEEPWQPVALAPVMAAAGDVELLIEATDVHGNTASTTRTVQVSPLDNASAPEVWAGCLLDGDAVVPGFPTALAVRAADDQAVESLAVFLDEVEYGAVSPVNLPSGEASFAWTPPAGAAVGTAYSVRLEARDFAGNVGVHELEVTVPGGTVLIGGRSLFDDYGGQEVTLAGGTFLVREPLGFADLRVVGGATMEAPTETPDLALTASGELRVQCGAIVRQGEAGSLTLDVPGLLSLGPGGSVDADGLGYAGGVSSAPAGQAPPWVTASLPDAGGSHGGYGRTDGEAGPVGEVYDSVYEPTVAGAGAARYLYGNVAGPGGEDGGGRIAIDAGTFRLEGEVTARGGDGPALAAGGAGGAVRVRAGSFSGRGRIDASGGDSAEFEGAGGGGRIALYAGAVTGSFDPAAQLVAAAGASRTAVSQTDLWAGAGTVFARLPGSTYGLLRIANGAAGESVGRTGPPTPLPALGSGAVTSFETAGADAWVTADATLHPRWRGAWVTLEDGAGAALGSYRVADLDAPDRMLLAGAAAAAGAVTYRGEYRFDRVELVAAGLEASDPVSMAAIALFDGGALAAGLQAPEMELRGGTVVLASDLAVDELVLGAGTTVVPSPERGAVRLVAAGDLTIESGVVIDVDGLGYPSTERWGPGLSPPWVAASTGSAGGSHAGLAQVGNDGEPGEVYDGVYEPRLPGGAGPLQNAKPGGGVVVLEAGGTLTFDGEIRARGISSTVPTPAGAGGAVALHAGTFTGGGTIDVSGGDGTYCGVLSGVSNGSGGGGRVAIHAGVSSGFDPASQVTAWGGYKAGCAGGPYYAGPGTILSRLDGQQYGTLLIDSGQTSGGTDREGPPVELPALGTGAVTLVEAAGADAWVTVDQVLHPRWLGAWMALLDGAATELGAFRVVEIDASGRARLEGAAAAAAAASFRGEYRFDAIQLLHGAGLDASDPVTGPDQVLSGNVELPPVVVAENLRLAAGAHAVPAQGDSLRFEVSGTMTIEPGAVIDVSGRGYPGGAWVPGGSPPWVAPAEPDSGGSHGGTGAWGDNTGSPGNTVGPPGEVYDSVYRPALAGGGGSNFGGPGGTGGGALVIRAGALVHDGTLKANALDSGAGGTVLLEVTGALSGSGTIEASGGHHDSCFQPTGLGMGGGGRIAILASDLVGFDPAVQAAARGGEETRCTPDTFGYGGAGTVYTRTAAMTYGELRIDNGVSETGADRGSIVTELPALGGGAVTLLEAAGADAWVTAEQPLHPRWLGGWMVLADAAAGELGAFEVVEMDGTTRARLAGAGGVAGAASYRGEYRFDRVELEHGAGFTASDPVAVTGDELVLSEDTTVPAVLSASSLVIEAGATVGIASGSSLQLDVATSLVIEVGAVIDVSRRGYGSGSPAGAPPSVTGSINNSGGSHGGFGLNGPFGGPAGEIYDSVFVPSLPGGGAGYSSSNAAAGGGVIAIRTGDLQLDGTLRAEGQDGGPSGAGGTVAVEVAGTLSGSGLIEAKGGPAYRCGSTQNPGVGGGGRIALRAGTLAGFDPGSQTRAWGGENRNCGVDGYRPAPAGTVFVHTAAMTWGELYIDNGTFNSGAVRPATTELPTIGRGVVGVAEPDAAVPADLWIEPEDPAQLFSLGVVGMHVRIGGVDYPVLAEDAASRRRILLGGAAGAVGVGDGFVGVYRFDAVTLRGEADLVLADGLVAGTLDLGSGSEVTSRDVDPPAISITAPAEGAPYTSGQTIFITADVTDNVAVAAVSFTLEGQTFVDDAAPWEWAVAAPAVTEERDATIELEAVDTDGNVAPASRTVHLQPLAAGDPPEVAIVCPTAGALVAPGTGLDLHVEASHEEGIERVELFLGADPTPQATDFDAPYVVRLTAPAGATGGEVLTARVRATAFDGNSAEVTLPVTVVEGAVIAADTTIAAGDTGLDGGSVIVAGGTLTVEGPHAFDDLIVLDGAALTHPPAVPGNAERLELSLAGDLFVACGGAIDASGRGLPRAPDARVLAEDQFTTSASLARWQVIDAPGASEGPSNWAWVSEGRVRQTKNINRQPALDGTHLLWKGLLGTDDYRAGVLFLSGDDDHIGLLFRYVDADNYYRFRWQKQTPQRMLERMENGQVTVLAGDAVPFVQSRWHRVEVEADGSNLSVWVDGEQVLTATDETHATGGVALYCNGNLNSSFDDFRVTEIPTAGEEDDAYAADHFATSGSLAGWQIVDRGTSSAPSNWIWDNGMIRQTTNIYTPGSPVGGTFAVWTGELPPDYRARVRLYSGDDDSIGLTFRRRDDDHYYRFLWSKQGGTRALDRIEGGVVTTLAQDAVPYVQSRWYTVAVEAIGPRLAVWVDGELVLSAWDEALPSGGVSLFCAGNVDSYFDDFQVGPPHRLAGEGGSHGGRGGGFAGGGAIYGSLFDPDDPGSGGGGPNAGAGGGVVRIAALGAAVLDGVVKAAGDGSDGSAPAAAGGSVRLDAASITGAGAISVDGGEGVGLHAAGAGGRIALYAGAIDSGLLSGTTAAGGLGDTADRTGAAGTIYLKLDSQPLGELILDNGGAATDQLTELPALLPGTVTAADATTITDTNAAFPDSVGGAEVYLDGDTGTLWPVLSNDGQTLLLDTSLAPLTAQPDDAYAGFYRFDAVAVRGGARGIARNPVWSTAPAEVEQGSEWWPDYQPSIEITEPAEGEGFEAGETLTATADVSDLLGVREVVFSLDGMEHTATVPPYSWATVIPVQIEIADHPLEVEVTNLSGQTTSTSVTVELRPDSDPEAPSVTITSALPLDGDVVLAGSNVHLDFHASDNGLVAGFALLVNGAVDQEVTAVDLASVDAAIDWTVPVAAPAGTVFTLRIEAYDYAGNVGADERQVQAPSGPVLTGTQTVATAHDGEDLTLTAGIFTVSVPLTPSSLVLVDGATLVSLAGQPLTLTVAGELRLQSGTAIDVSGKGFTGGVSGSPEGGAPPWVVGSLSDAGGSHGGPGSWWDVPETSGEVYDSVVRPRLAGGGGALDNDGSGNGQPGGGVVEIVAGSVVLNGNVVADGTHDDSGGRAAGAGGTVRIETGVLSGSGQISADGGWMRLYYQTREVGSGGGGRIALEVGGFAGGFSPSLQASAFGAPRYNNVWTVLGCSAPGTVFVRDGSMTYGELRIEHAAECAGRAVDTDLPELGSGSVVVWEVEGADAWVTAGEAFLPRWDGAWMVLEDAGGSELGAFEVITIDGSGRALLAGASGVTGAASYRGEYRFDRVSVLAGAGLVARDRVTSGAMELDGATRLSGEVVATDLTVVSGAVVTPAEGDTLRLEVPGTLTIETGARLDVTGRGYGGGTTGSPQGGVPPLVEGSLSDAGGSHGGLGSWWDVAQTSGEAYDSVVRPRLAGGGGSLDNDGSGDGLAGGGVIEILAGSVVLDGEVVADGTDNDNLSRPAGAGGTVRLDAVVLSGSGLIRADGGWMREASSTRHVGSGGGGRVALEVGSFSGFDPSTQVSALGAARYNNVWTVQGCSSPGTVWVRDDAMTHGELRVEHASECTSKPSLNTLLPALGAGVVGVAEPDPGDPADLWIEPQDPNVLFDLGVEGMTVRIDGSDYPVIDQSADRRRVLLEGAAGIVDVGDAYQGIYQFDTVTVKGGAVLEFLDPAEVGTFDVDADSQVIQP